MRLTRKQFEEAVQGSGMNPYARFICLTYAGKAGYTNDPQEVWPSMAWVAEVTGINKDIVAKYVKALVKDGWLIPAQMHGRAQGYYLGQGLLTVRTLMKAQRKSNLLMESEVSPDAVDPNLLMESEVSPDGQELITKNNHIEVTKEEPKTEPVAPEVVADAPTSPLLLEQEGDVKYQEFLDKLDTPLSREEKENVRIWRKDGLSLERIYELVVWNREDPWI